MMNSITTLLAFCLASFAPASAAHLRELSNQGQQPSTTWTVGYNLARNLWQSTRPPYPCNSQSDVLQEFWPDVISEVYPECQSRYSGLWNTNTPECESGADAFVSEQVGDCASLSDCNALGDIAAEGVAGVFCNAQYPNLIDHNPFCKFVHFLVIVTKCTTAFTDNLTTVSSSVIHCSPCCLHQHGPQSMPIDGHLRYSRIRGHQQLWQH